MAGENFRSHIGRPSITLQILNVIHFFLFSATPPPARMFPRLRRLDGRSLVHGAVYAKDRAAGALLWRDGGGAWCGRR
jgi:hypothetical protein